MFTLLLFFSTRLFRAVGALPSGLLVYVMTRRSSATFSPTCCALQEHTRPEGHLEAHISNLHVIMEACWCTVHIHDELFGRRDHAS